MDNVGMLALKAYLGYSKTIQQKYWPFGVDDLA